MIVWKPIPDEDEEFALVLGGKLAVYEADGVWCWEIIAIDKHGMRWARTGKKKTIRHAKDAAMLEWGRIKEAP